jgi:hypothetical protein
MKQCGMLPDDKIPPANDYDDDDGELEGCDSDQQPTDYSTGISLPRGDARAAATHLPAELVEASSDAVDDLPRSLSATDTLRRLSLLSGSSSSDDERTSTGIGSKAKFQSQQPQQSAEVDDDDFSNVLPFLLSLQGNFSQF